MPSPQDRLEDDAFDAVYPPNIRRISRHFWTPVAVARAAAALFVRAGAHDVLDVGAGVGKFVLSAALAEPTLKLVGVEQRGHLVDLARHAQGELGIANARFEVGDATEVPWSAFEGIYLFNPLAENLNATADRIDDRVELTRHRFRRDRERVERALRHARLGTAVVTYHGSGTRIPASYELEATEQRGSDWVRLWIKRRESHEGAYFLEADGGSVRQVSRVR